LDQEAGHFQDAEKSTLAALDAGRHAGPLTEVCALANSGRCLAQLERELERAELFLVEAESRPSVPAARVDASWGLGLIAWHRNDLVEAARRLGHALEGASGLENHWAAFECMSRLALVEVEAGASDRVLARADELRHAAGRLAGGSEQALAETIIALASYASDSACAAEPFERSLDELRRQDSKAALSMVLIAAAQLDRAQGRQQNALRWAREAHGAAELVGRQRQLDRSRQLLDALDEKQQAEPENER
jgi:hypothetical protein